MSTSLQSLKRDLLEETLSLDDVLGSLDDEDWAIPTLAAGWTIAHQVAHLAWTDDALLLAMTSPESFASLRAEVTAPESTVIDDAAANGAASAPRDVICRWRSGHKRVLHQFLKHPPTEKIPWFGPPMGPASALTARIMETFAHGQDIRDALGLPAAPSNRLRHVIHLAVMAMHFSFTNRSLPPPQSPVRIEAEFQGETWAWGPASASDRVTGDALDLALLVTRRRHPGDCHVLAEGETARAWIAIAQAYAGPAGAGRARS